VIDFELAKSYKVIDLVDVGCMGGGPKEWSGSCPRCGGSDRFHVNREKGWFCRQCTGEPGSGGHWHDALDFVMFRDGISDFTEAYRRLTGNKTISQDDRQRLMEERQARETERAKTEQELMFTQRSKLDVSGVSVVYHKNLTELDKRDLWYERGLSDYWIDAYKVGYNPRFAYQHKDQTFYSPSLTIPTFQQKFILPDMVPSWDCVCLVHRLLDPQAQGGKYRPEMHGLGKPLFIADLTGFISDRVLIVEGEIKAMVVYSHVFDAFDRSSCGIATLQVIGIAGKSFKPEWLAQLDQAEQLWICLDPDATREAESMAASIGPDKTRIIDLPGKIDDMILSGEIDVMDFPDLLKAARRL
jgi:hypothetical protein